ncbi:MAG: PilZ domain-containing protein [Gammaproteobacteria bacterium]|nr:PilZ domain-containing protein [Gammaproteobacteria bacterium]
MIKVKERRLYPRFDVILPARMWVAGEPLDGNVFDISMGGLQMGCDHASVVKAVPTAGQIVTPGLDLQVKVSFQIPGESQELNTICRIAACRRVSDNEYRVGLEIVEFATESESHLYEAYIQQRIDDVA